MAWHWHGLRDMRVRELLVVQLLQLSHVSQLSETRAVCQLQ